MPVSRVISDDKCVAFYVDDDGMKWNGLVHIQCT